MSKKNFLLTICMLAGLTASAQWVKPVPKLSPASIVVASEEYDDAATSYYFWNEECQAFLGEGNKWNSQTSMDEGRGLQIYFQKYKVDGEAVPNCFYMNVYLGNDHPNGNRPRWDWFWINIDEGGEKGWGYTDYKEPGCDRHYPNDPLWDYEISGDNVRIKTAPLMPNYNLNAIGHECYLGKAASEAATSTVISPICTTSDNINWRVVSKADYDVFRPRYLAYAEALKLKEAIDASKETYSGIDLSSVEAVYNNTNSTEEELKAAHASITDIEKEYAATHIIASVDNPYDATIFITNPNFDGNVNGWEGGSLAWNNTISEFWSDNTNTHNYHQTLTDLPNGVYKIEVYALHRIGNPGDKHYAGGALADEAQVRRTSQIYANNYWMLTHDLADGARSENIHPDQYARIGDKIVPDGVYYADKAFNQYGDYNNELFAAVTDGTLTIGMRCEPREAFSWTASDTWRLHYYGDSQDAREVMKANLLSNLKDYSDEFVYAPIKEQYMTAVSELEGATDYATIEEAYTTAMGLYYEMEKSRNAYNHFIAYIEEVEPQTEELDCAENDDLLDYLEDNVGRILDETSLTAEELAEEEAKIAGMLEAAIKGTVEPGKDYTSLIPNHDMAIADFKSAGWEVSFEGAGDGSIKGNKDHLDRVATQYHVGEIWKFNNFDLSYTLTGMPRGIYEVEIPALYRNQARDFSEPAPVEAYVNDLSINIMSALDDAVSEENAISTEANPGEGYNSPEEWGTANCFNKYTVQDNNEGWPNDWCIEVEGTNYYIPGSCDGAGVAFYAGRYNNKVYGVVGEDGVLKIGLRSKTHTPMNEEWVALGHIKMTYMGVTDEALEKIREEVDAQASIYRERTDEFYAGYLTDLDNALQNILLCKNTDDVIEASAAIQKVYENIDKSAALYKEIHKLLGDEESGLYNVAVRFFEAGKITSEQQVAYMDEAEKYSQQCEDRILPNDRAQEVIDHIKAIDIMDVIYIRGGLITATGDDFHSYDYPMFKNAEGKYEGTAEFRTECHGNQGIYPGHRVLVVFHYLDKDICAMDNATRFLSENPAPRKLKIDDNSSWFTTWGGEWKFTIDLSDSTLVCEPVGDMVYKNQIYAVGNLKGNHWALNETTAKHWELVHQGKGIYQGSLAFNDGVENGEVTLFTSDMWFTGNWGESRIGSDEYARETQAGEEVPCNRFMGDKKWLLDPSHKYFATYDLTRGIVRFDINDLEGDDTEESPLLISNYKDLMMMRAYLTQGQTHYFALTQDIDMNGLGWSQLNGLGEQDGKEQQRWIHFDGRGHCIKNFGGATGLQSTDDNSFFGLLGGTVKNVGFVNVDMVEDEAYMTAYECIGSKSMAAVAGVIGSTKYDGTTTVENVFVTGNIDGGRTTGAFAGDVAGTTLVKNIFAQADVRGVYEEVTGGLFGDVASTLTLQNAYFYGKVASENPIIGAQEESATLNATNVVNWTLYSSDANYNYTGSNHADLQSTVVAFDPAVWGCPAEADALPVLRLFGDELPSAIQGITVDGQAGAVIYDLAGRRVSKATRGLYIVGGKKILVK